MILTVSLPCKPVVYKYLQNKYGTDAILTLPDDDWIKLLTANMLHRDTAEKDAEITLQYYTKTVKIAINMAAYERFGDALSKTAIRAINGRIEDVIHQQLFQFLSFYVHVANYRLKDAILMFQDMYALQEEYYAHDTIKKYYQRKIRPYVFLQKSIALNVPFKQPRNYKRTA